MSAVTASSAAGAVEQTGAQIVFGEGNQCVFAMHIAQIGAGNNILVHPDRAVDFPAATKQAAECKMRFQGLIINLDHAHKNFQRLIRLLIQQKIQALDVISIQAARGIRGITVFIIPEACEKIAQCCRQK